MAELAIFLFLFPTCLPPVSTLLPYTTGCTGPLWDCTICWREEFFWVSLRRLQARAIPLGVPQKHRNFLALWRSPSAPGAPRLSPGSLLTVQDLAAFQPEVVAPLEMALGNYTLYSPPPPAGGAILNFILNVLQGKPFIRSPLCLGLCPAGSLTSWFTPDFGEHISFLSL